MSTKSFNRVIMNTPVVAGVKTYASTPLNVLYDGLTLNLGIVMLGVLGGTFSLQGCNDYGGSDGQSPKNLGNWLALPSGAQPTAPGVQVGSSIGVTAGVLAAGFSQVTDAVTTAVGVAAPFYNTPVATISSASAVLTGVTAGMWAVLSGNAGSAGTYQIVSVGATSITVAVVPSIGMSVTTGNTLNIYQNVGTITDSGAGFVAAGVAPGMNVIVSTGADAGTYQILSLTSTVLTVGLVLGSGSDPMVGSSGATYAIPQLDSVTIAQFGQQWLRLVYTTGASDNGTITATVCAKEA